MRVIGLCRSDESGCQRIFCNKSYPLIAQQIYCRQAPPRFSCLKYAKTSRPAAMCSPIRVTMPSAPRPCRWCEICNNKRTCDYIRMCALRLRHAQRSSA